jgi:hypothetical protein
MKILMATGTAVMASATPRNRHCANLKADSGRTAYPSENPAATGTNIPDQLIGISLSGQKQGGPGIRKAMQKHTQSDAGHELPDDCRQTNPFREFCKYPRYNEQNKDEVQETQPNHLASACVPVIALFRIVLFAAES